MKRTSVPPPIASIQSVNWPFLNIRITSTPLIVARAVRIDWKPSVGRIRRFSLPWKTALPCGALTREGKTHVRLELGPTPDEQAQKEIEEALDKGDMPAAKGRLEDINSKRARARA